uniref:NECAP endocytosis associated 2 n=1 Tax=Anser cygnoides TaxID=8845 RepID=A0A8B9EV75_ANSCY
SRPCTSTACPRGPPTAATGAPRPRLPPRSPLPGPRGGRRPSRRLLSPQGRRVAAGAAGVERQAARHRPGHHRLHPPGGQGLGRAFRPGARGAVPRHRRGERDGLQQIFRHPHRGRERWWQFPFLGEGRKKSSSCRKLGPAVVAVPFSAPAGGGDGHGGVWNGRRAFIGVGFVDRGDAFDFNVALQDHFKWVKQQSELAKQAENPDQGPKLDLGFKEGQTIKLNIASMKKKEGATGNTRPRPAGPGGLSLLPPPPGGKSSSPAFPSGEQPSSSLSAPVRLPGTPITDSLLSWPQPAAAPAAPATDVWGDFAKASGSAPNQTQANAGWVQF